MKTFRSGAHWSLPEWLETNVVGDVTTWTYDPASGLVTAKTDAAGKSVTYTYTVDGQLATRTWARKAGNQSLVTTYSYDPATGELLKIDYSDSTPDITYTFGCTIRRISGGLVKKQLIIDRQIQLAGLSLVIQEYLKGFVIYEKFISLFRLFNSKNYLLDFFARSTDNHFVL